MNIEKFLEKKAPLIDKTIEKYIPRKFSKNSILFKVNPPMYSYNLEPLNKAIAEPIWDMLDRGGKRWRPALFLLICEALGKESDYCLDFSIIPEVIHNGTLVIDDIEDSSELRRGKPCTYKIFQMDIAVNAGNAMYYLPLLPLMVQRKKLSSKVQRDFYEVYIQEMINLSMGQAMDIAWHKDQANANELDENDYLQMCAYKTGTLARMAAKMAAVLTGADKSLVEKLGRFAESIGVAFQMQDDILDLTGEEFAKKKGGVGQDITEGKIRRAGHSPFLCYFFWCPIHATESVLCVGAILIPALVFGNTTNDHMNNIISRHIGGNIVPSITDRVGRVITPSVV